MKMIDKAALRAQLLKQIEIDVPDDSDTGAMMLRNREVYADLMVMTFCEGERFAHAGTSPEDVSVMFGNFLASSMANLLFSSAKPGEEEPDADAAHIMIHLLVKDFDNILHELWKQRFRIGGGSREVTEGHGIDVPMKDVADA